jgi:hypothetical protein
MFLYFVADAPEDGQRASDGVVYLPVDQLALKIRRKHLGRRYAGDRNDDVHVVERHFFEAFGSLACNVDPVFFHH